MEAVQNYLVDSKNYTILKKINGGGFGAVYKVRNKDTNEILAAKVATGGSQNRMINREIRIMMHFDHPTIEKLRGYSNKDFYENKIPTIFMNFEANGSLRDAIEKSQKGLALENYDNTARQIILIGIARGMMILHKNNVIHRDLKPENILLDENLHPLITDFGLSKFFEIGHSMSQSMNPGTCFYMAPEIMSSEKFDTKADVYSFGILMYEVITESHPYPSLKNKNFLTASQLLKDGNLRPKFDKFVKKSFHKLLESCLSTNPNERPTFEDIYLKLAYSFDDFIVDDEDDDDDDDENIESEDKYFLPDVDKERVEDYIKEIEVEKSDERFEKIQKDLIKLHAEFEESKKENMILRKENQEIKEKYDSLKSEFNEFKKKINFSEDITSIKNEIKKLENEKDKKSQITIPDDLLTRLKTAEDDSKTAIKKCDKLFEDIKKLKESSSSKNISKQLIPFEHSNSKFSFCYAQFMNLYYDFFLIDPSKYIDIKKIGSGRFGSIFLAKDCGTRYAIRQIGSKNTNDNVTYYFIKEVETFIQIRAHPCICRFYGFSVKAPQRIVLEYLENGSLEDIFNMISNNVKVNFWDGTMKSKTVFGIAAALFHLHNQGIFHRCLTPSCILFDSNNEPRLTDFGLSLREDEIIKDHKILNGFFYQAPEISECEYDHLCDNFSYGVILYQIVTGKKAYSSIKEFKSFLDKPPLPVEISPKLAPMISDLCDRDPDNRPELIDIIKALIDYNQPLFSGTDMNSYKKYRERVIKSTFFTKKQLDYLKQPTSIIHKYRFENYLQSAEKGNACDMVAVANCYEKGIGTGLDLSESLNWLFNAAQEKHPEALYKLANYYCDGCDFIDPDQEQYIKYLKEASDLKYPPAIIKYASILLTGEYNVIQDINKAEQILKLISDKPNNNGEAQYLLAKFYKNKDKEQAIKYFTLACDNKVEGALCDYALMLLQGNYVSVDQPEGMIILKQIADKGFPMANYNLGLIYENGLYNNPKDTKKALDYYKIAADKDYVPAIIVIAKALFMGHFVDIDYEQDPIQAARLFEYAAASNDPEGLFWWATFLNNYSNSSETMLELNIKYGGTPINISLALLYYKKAAEAGFVPSMLRLGELYHLGVVGEQNFQLAIHYLQMAVNRGSKEAQNYLSKLEDL